MQHAFELKHTQIDDITDDCVSVYDAMQPCKIKICHLTQFSGHDTMQHALELKQTQIDDITDDCVSAYDAMQPCRIKICHLTHMI